MWTEYLYLNILLKGEKTGEWIEVDSDWIEEFKEAHNSQKELLITDYDNNFFIDIPKHISLSELAHIASIMDTVNDSNRILEFKALMEYLKDYDSAYERFNNEEYRYYHNATNDQLLGIALADDYYFGIQIPESLQPFVKFKNIGEYFRGQVSGDFTQNGFIELF